MKSALYYASFLLFLSFASFIVSNDGSRDAFDDLIAFVDTPEVIDLIDNTDFDSTRQASKAAVITILNEFEILPLFELNLFNRTNVLKSRSLLDFPEFIPFRHDHEKRAFYVDLFYNQYSRMFFTKSSSNICSYLNISGYINAFRNIIKQVNRIPDVPLETDQFLEFANLLQTFTVQERRFGLMIGGKTKINGWHLNIFAPWYYLERNHFVNEEVQEDLRKLGEDIFGKPTTPEEIKAAEKKQHELEDQHLISDQFGIGDTRIFLDYSIIKKKHMYTRVGFVATIPTAFAMKKGLRGNSFCLIKNRPLLDLQEVVGIIQEAIEGQVESEIQARSFAFAAFDNVGAMILDSPLGNGGHLGLGIMLRNRSPLSNFVKLDWARRYIMRSFVSFEYLLPKTEWRSFRVPVDEALFNARDLTETDDMAVVNSNYAFLQRQLTDRLFPIAIQATVYPGFVFRWSSQMCYEGDYAGFTFGTDTYVRNTEKLTNLNANKVTQHFIDQYHAECPFSYQAKAIGSIFFKVHKPDKLWVISLVADYTYMFRGIGSDFMLSFNTDVTF